MNPVALGSLTHFWPPGDDLRYLGYWCLLPEHLGRWRKEQHRILPSPWRDRVRFEAAAGQVQCTSGKLVRFIGELLNESLGTRFSQRYWTMVLWVWANWFTAETFDRYTHLLHASDLLNGIDTVGVSPSIAIDVGAFQEPFRDALFELQRLSRILHWLGMPFEVRACPDEWLVGPEERTVSEEHAASGREAEQGEGRRAADESCGAEPGAGRCAAGEPSGAEGGAGEYVAAEPPAVAEPGDVMIGFLQHRREATAAMLAGARVGRVQSFEGSILDVDLPCIVAVDPEFRTGLFDFPAEGEFERLLCELLPNYLPLSLFEGFGPRREDILSRCSRLPRMVVSGLGCQESEAFTLLAAEAVEAGARLVCTQHAATYNTYRFLPARDFELSIADDYLAWGSLPGSRSSAPAVPCPPLSHYVEPGRRASTRRQDAQHLVFFANQFVPHLIDFRSSVRAHGSDDYLDWQIRFFDALSSETRAHVILRVKGQSDSSLYAFMKRRFPEITIEGKEVSFDERIHGCRLAVCDCLTQVYAECLMLVPTVLFWDPLIWEQCAVAESLHRALRQVGIYRDSPEAAAQQVQAVWSDPEAWWRAPAVAAARDAYLHGLFELSADWQASWSAELGRQWRAAERS